MSTFEDKLAAGNPNQPATDRVLDEVAKRRGVSRDDLSNLRIEYGSRGRVVYGNTVRGDRTGSHSLIDDTIANIILAAFNNSPDTNVVNHPGNPSILIKLGDEVLLREEKSGATSVNLLYQPEREFEPAIQQWTTTLSPSTPEFQASRVINQIALAMNTDPQVLANELEIRKVGEVVYGSGGETNHIDSYYAKQLLSLLQQDVSATPAESVGTLRPDYQIFLGDVLLLETQWSLSGGEEVLINQTGLQQSIPSILEVDRSAPSDHNWAIRAITELEQKTLSTKQTEGTRHTISILRDTRVRLSELEHQDRAVDAQELQEIVSEITAGADVELDRLNDYLATNQNEHGIPLSTDQICQIADDLQSINLAKESLAADIDAILDQRSQSTVQASHPRSEPTISEVVESAKTLVNPLNEQPSKLHRFEVAGYTILLSPEGETDRLTIKYGDRVLVEAIGDQILSEPDTPQSAQEIQGWTRDAAGVFQLETRIKQEPAPKEPLGVNVPALEVTQAELERMPENITKRFVQSFVQSLQTQVQSIQSQIAPLKTVQTWLQAGKNWFATRWQDAQNYRAAQVAHQLFVRGYVRTGEDRYRHNGFAVTHTGNSDFRVNNLEGELILRFRIDAASQAIHVTEAAAGRINSELISTLKAVQPLEVVRGGDVAERLHYVNSLKFAAIAERSLQLQLDSVFDGNYYRIERNDDTLTVTAQHPRPELDQSQILLTVRQGQIVHSALSQHDFERLGITPQRNPQQQSSPSTRQRQQVEIG